jgi:hypothetical protein
MGAKGFHALSAIFLQRRKGCKKMFDFTKSHSQSQTYT